jgi:ATP-dependent Lhr-like helicase
VLAATDPANPYGAAVPWPEREGARPQRVAGAQVILRDGHLAAWLGRAERNLMTFLPDSEPEASETSAAIAGALAGLVETGRRRVLLVAKVDGGEPSLSPLAPFLREAGFLAGSRGFLKRMALAEARQSALSGRKSVVDKDVAVGGTLLVPEPR